MAEIYLNVEWGETPFQAEGWPGPLLRPEPHEPSVTGGEPIVIPDALLERYQAAEREFLAVQAELRVIAKEHGEIGLWLKDTKMRSLTWKRKLTPTWITW